MSEINANNGFDFYETLRYFLPGLLLVFLLGYIAFPEYGRIYSVSEKVVFGVLIGFIIHSFGMYKRVPGVSYIRNQFRDNLKKCLCDVDNSYTRWDIASITMSSEERQYFRRYFGLGAFKLDLVVILGISLICYAASLIQFIITSLSISLFGVKNIMILPMLLISIYILRDDGLNDLKRAFNLKLVIILKYKQRGDLNELLDIIKENKDMLIMGERNVS